jgi:hypothetical protein
MQKIKNILKENHKNISLRKIYQNTPKIIEEYWLRKIKIYKIKKYDSVFSTNKGPIGKERLNLRRKIQIGCLRIQLKFSRFN